MNSQEFRKACMFYNDDQEHKGSESGTQTDDQRQNNQKESTF